MESAHVGKHAKTYADNDKMAAARIALVYLQGNAPCVWIPDAGTLRKTLREELSLPARISDCLTHLKNQFLKHPEINTA